MQYIINESTLLYLLKSSDKLQALEDGDVSNWAFYEESLDAMEKKDYNKYIEEHFEKSY